MNHDAYRQIRDEILNRLIFLMSVIAVPVAAFSIFRYSQIGWRNVFLIHILFVPLTIVGCAFRKLISYQKKVAIVLGSFYLIAILGFVNFPITGHGLEFLILAVLVSVVFLPRKTTIIVVVISVLTIVLIGALSVKGIIDPMADSAILSALYTGWINTLASFSLLMIAVVLTVGNIGQLLNKKIVELSELNRELQGASEEIRTLKGIVPICSACKNIRDDEGFWHRVENYVRDHTHAEFSHGICPDCFAEYYPVNSDKESTE